MSRALAWIWLGVVLLLGAHVAWRLHQGLVFRTDLLALLPRDEADPELQGVKDSVAQSISRRIVLLVGAHDRDRARHAAAIIAQALARSSLVDFASVPADAGQFAKIGALYFPYRAGLLSEDDRRRLLAGQAEALSTRALAQIFSLAGVTDARLLRNDPFMLLPAFLAALPVPSGRLSLDQGMLSVGDGGTMWILLGGRLRDDPYAIDVQARLTTVLGSALEAVRAAEPDVQVLRGGAVFFAEAGARKAVADMSALGLVATAGTIALVLFVFRALSPLLLSALAIGVGMGVGFSASLLLFRELHLMAMLLGLSLIGIAVDYSLYYCVEAFAPGERTPAQRLARVLPGITLGAITTAIGYGTFLLAPFPGLRQVATFSAVGLIASFATVVLWLPLLDRRGPVRHGRRLLAAAALLWRFWEAPRLQPARYVAIGVLIVVGAIGAWKIVPLDDVRRMQSLSPALVREQTRIQAVTGVGFATQFFVARAPDDGTALEREEMLFDRLFPLRRAGALRGYRAPASFVPSAARQRENRALRHAKLDDVLLPGYLEQIGLPGVEPDPAPERRLTLAMAAQVAPLGGLLNDLIVPAQGDATHLVMLDEIADTGAVAGAARGIDGVAFVDPAADFSMLLTRYRHRAVDLIAVSVVLMVPLLALRYGLSGAIRVLLPAVATVVLVPIARAISGAPFTFFDAMGLVLVLSIAVDYAVFCAEADAAYKPVALLGVGMAMVSTLLSFGILARSDVAAVHAFGGTMLLGVTLAFFLAPLAGKRQKPVHA